MKSDWHQLATLEEQTILDDICEGEWCWWNPETGYREYCSKHEAVIADIVHRLKELRSTNA